LRNKELPSDPTVREVVPAKPSEPKKP
jgi:hypothetical protein